MFAIKETTSQILIFFYLPSFVFKEIQVIVEGDNPSEKNVIVKEEPDGIDTDGIGNL